MSNSEINTISEDEKFILNRHAIVQQSLAIWSGVSMALVFSYTGALFSFLHGQPLNIRLFAFFIFAIAYGGIISGTVIIGQTLSRHRVELGLLKETQGLSSLGEWTLGRTKVFGMFNRILSRATMVVFSGGLFLATIFYGG